MASESKKRPLIKGPIRRPKAAPWSVSSTQEPASRDKISVKGGKEKEAEITVVKFNSLTLPMPFLNPKIMEERRQAEKQRQLDEQKKRKATEMVSRNI